MTTESLTQILVVAVPVALVIASTLLYFDVQNTYENIRKSVWGGIVNDKEAYDIIEMLDVAIMNDKRSMILLPSLVTPYVAPMQTGQRKHPYCIGIQNGLVPRKHFLTKYLDEFIANYEHTPGRIRAYKDACQSVQVLLDLKQRES